MRQTRKAVRIVTLLLAIILLVGCAHKTNLSWQEQYDLGLRYLSEGNYEEAILAFNAAIDIDPKRPEAYIGLAELYIEQDDYERAKSILEEAIITADASNELSELLDEVKNFSNDPGLFDENLRIFDGTFWSLGFGQTMGSSFDAQFYSDGTFLARSYGSGDLSDGTYQYDGEILSISFEGLENILYNKKDDGFISIDTYEMQVGENHYTVIPSDGAYFSDYYSDTLPAAQTLPDGEYYATLYGDGTTVIDGCTYETVDLLSFYEMSDEEIASMKIGDIIELPDQDIVISSLEFVDEGYLLYIINDHWLLVPVSGTNMWRLAWPSHSAYTYDIGTYTLPANDPKIIDKRTYVNNFEQNIYGVQYQGELDKYDPFFDVLSLSEYFSFSGYSTEEATIQVVDGTITEIFIQYRP